MGGGFSRLSSQDCPAKKILSESADNFRRGGSFSVSLFLGTDKVKIRVGGERQDFPTKLFCLTVPKTFVGELFCAVFQKISGSQRNYG